MTNMFERVARAIAAVDGYDIDGLAAYAAASNSVAKKEYEMLLRKARAAIEAMYEPTDEMITAGCSVSRNRNSRKDRALQAEEYRAMIGAALDMPL